VCRYAGHYRALPAAMGKAWRGKRILLAAAYLDVLWTVAKGARRLADARRALDHVFGTTRRSE